jgi:hypothetical protein
VREEIEAAWTVALGWSGWPILMWTAAVVVVLGVMVLWTASVLRRRSLDAKLSAAFALTQAGVAFTVVTGVHDFFTRVLSTPSWEAWILAGFIEAVQWGAAGFIYLHGRTPGTTGWGPARSLFWAAVLGGATLAVLGAKGIDSGIGRVVITVLGAWMLVLRLQLATRRSGQASRWRWTPARLLFAIGAKEPEDADITNPAREYQIRRIARAIRWSNGRWPFAWWGGRTLVREAERTDRAVVQLARRRAAMVQAVRTTVQWDHPVMVRLLEEAGTDLARTGPPPTPDGPDPRSADGPDYETDHIRTIDGPPDQSGPEMDHGPDRTPDVDLDDVDLDKWRERINTVQARVGKEWPDVTFTGRGIYAMNLPRLRNRDTCRELAGILNRLAEGARADRAAAKTS